MFGSQSPRQGVRVKEHTPPGRIERHDRLGVDARDISSPMSSDQQRLKQSSQVAHAMIKQVVQTFRKAVAAGTADLTKATLCLKNSREIVRVATRQHVVWDTRSLQDLGVGSMMLNWLWSSGLQDTDEILLDQEFIHPLSFFLALEGDVEQLMRWFKSLNLRAKSKRNPSEVTHQNIDNPMAECEQSQASLPIPVQHARPILHNKGQSTMYRKVFASGGLLRGWVSQNIRENQQFILAEIVRTTLRNDSNGSLDSGLRIFLQTITDPENSNDSYHREFVFQPAAKLIVSHIERGDIEGRVDSSLYDAFTQTADLWSRTSTLIRATLQLYHPVSPSWAFAYYHIQTLAPSIIARMKPSQRERTVRLGLSAAETMLSHDSTLAARKAMKTMSVLEEHFGHELGVLKRSPKTTHEDQKARHTDLEELDFAMTT